jgi:5-methylcytosine-specific restriction endonuclease McrA
MTEYHEAEPPASTPLGYSFLEALERLLEHVTIDSDEDRNRAISLIRKRRAYCWDAERFPPVLELTCALCRRPIQLARALMSPNHKQRGHAYLQRLHAAFCEGKGKVSPDGTKLNGYHAKTVCNYTCGPCWQGQIHQCINEQLAERELHNKLERQLEEEERQLEREVLTGSRSVSRPVAYQIWANHLARCPADREALVSMPYADFLQSNYWKVVRGYLFYKRGRSCELCAKTDGVVDVHHKSYANRGREWDNLGDLILLCRPCHAKHHDKLEGGVQ